MHEVELAYWRFREQTDDIWRTQEWGRYADLFTPDAVYRVVGHRETRGREAIRAMTLTNNSTVPGNLFAQREVNWHALDLSRGRVVHEVRHTMCDPGDGSQHFVVATSMFGYGYDGLMASVDVVHAPEAHRSMYRGWIRAAQRCGTPVDGALLALLDEPGGNLLPPISETS